MKRVRGAIGVVGVLALGSGAVIYLMPIEDETCAQIYEDVYGRSHDPQLLQTTLWRCLGAMRTVQQRISDDVDPEKTRQIARDLERARLAIERATDAARPARQMPPEVSRAETEAALMAQVRPSLCPRLATLTDGNCRLSLLQARGDVVLYNFSYDCPKCREKHLPPFSWLRPDHTLFCEDNPGRGGDCDAKLAALQVLFEISHQGSPAELKTLLGCP